ncbi:hypothetical protein C1I95_12040, partial [Micromonospora craterilacus]
MRRPPVPSALLATAALATATLVAVVAALPAAGSFAATPTAAGAPITILAACTAPTWAEGNTYQAGSRVTYNGRTYQALVTHTAHVGAGWNPAATPSLWTDLGPCDG